MNDTFESILGSQSDDIKAPIPLPAGTYLCIVDGPPEPTKVGQKQTDALNFKLKPMQANGDVDHPELIQALNGSNLQDKSIRHRLFVTRESVWRLKQFLDHCGVEGGKTLKERIAEAPGHQVYVSISHRISEDGRPFVDVKGTAAV